MRNLEVVILNDYASLNGGSSAVAIASARGMAARGMHVTYFSCVGPVAPQLNGVANLDVICLEQYELAKNPSRLHALVSGLRNVRAVAALRTLLARKDPARTIVHAHTWMMAMSPYALHTVAELGFPLVVTLHDFFITCPTGSFFVHPTSQLCNRTPLSASCLACNCDRRNYGHKVWRSARTALQNNVLRIPDKVSRYIGVSRFSAEIMRPYLHEGTPVSIVRNPADCVDEGPSPVKDNQEFLYIGRFVTEKGARVFAEAVSLSGLPATFIGQGDMEPQLKALCPRATFTGWLEPAAIRQHLRRARAVVCSSLCHETLGLVAVEATAAGVPVIVADRCAATDVIQDGKTGVYFAHGSAQSLAAAMTMLSRDDELARQLGAAAYRWYWDDPWSSDNHLNELLPVYESIRTERSDPVPAFSHQT